MRRALLLVLVAACFDHEQMLEDQELPPLESAPAQGDFAAFMACMQLDDFVASNMAGAWSTVASDTGACTTCHTADGMFSGDAQRFFDDLKHRTYVQVQFFTFDRTTNVVDVNTETIPRVGKAVAPYGEHPRFNATKGLDATFDLYDRTIERLAARNCQ